MRTRRLRTVFGTDLRFHATRPLVWVLLFLLALTSFGLSSGQMAIQTGDSTVGGDSKAWLTSEFSVGMQLSMLVLMIYAFFVAIAAGMLVIRDRELAVGELLHSTPLRAGEYVWGRFFAVTLCFLGILALHLLCMIVIYHVLDRSSMDEMRGPFHPINYLRPALVFAVPTIVFFAGTSFAIGALTRKPILVFFLPVALMDGLLKR